MSTRMTQRCDNDFVRFLNRGRATTLPYTFVLPHQACWIASTAARFVFYPSAEISALWYVSIFTFHLRRRRLPEASSQGHTIGAVSPSSCNRGAVDLILSISPTHHCLHHLIKVSCYAQGPPSVPIQYSDHFSEPASSENPSFTYWPSINIVAFLPAHAQACGL